MSQKAKPRGPLPFGGEVKEFVSESTPWWPQPKKAPTDSPNVIVMLIDDMGFSDLGPFGSEIPTPEIDALARNGWTFTNYHTAPMCSPARAALLTGLNPHRAGFGFVAHIDPGYPGFTCELPKNAPTLAESLGAAGYATFGIGKWHLTLESRLHDGAEKSSWPLQRGFDRYFGSMDGFTSLHHPHRLVRDNSVVDVPEFPEDYFLTDQLVAESLGMISDLRACDAKKPFFLYFAHTAVHGPIQAKAEDIQRQRGRYREGWNVMRERRFQRQRELGIISEHALLPIGNLAGDADIPEWDSLNKQERELFARHMEVYAAAVESIDRSVGALVAKLRELGELENTLIVLTSDNGGSAEGGTNGTRSYFAQFGNDIGLPTDWIKDVPREIEDIGGPKLYAQYPSGWARVSNTPFRDFKASTYEGGVHAPLIVSWPAAPEATHGLRDQFVFVSDLTPTILDLVGVTPLEEIGGVETERPDGQSVVEMLRDPSAAGREQQYFECAGRRAFVSGDWKAVSAIPPRLAEGGAGGAWELYNLQEDPTESRNLAAFQPNRVLELAEKWRTQAWANSVFPLDDTGTLHHTRPETESALTEPVALTPFRPPLERFRSAKLTVLRSFSIDIEVMLGEKANGVVIAHGDQGGGYLLAFHDSSPMISYNAYGVMHRVEGSQLKEGPRSLLMHFTEVDGLRWQVSLEVDGIIELELEPVPMLLGMAPFTGISVGYDYGGPVDWTIYEQYRSFPFTGGLIDYVRYVPGQRSVHDPTILKAVGEAAARIAD